MSLVCTANRSQLVLWTVRATGIVRCQIVAWFDAMLMSESGYKQTSSHPKSMSALPPRADIPSLAEAATEFYQHDRNWQNRLWDDIEIGDHCLARRDPVTWA